MKTEIDTDLQIFVTQKKTNALNKTYYLTYRKDGVYYNYFSTKAGLITKISGINLIAGIREGIQLFAGETSIPDDEEVKSVLGFSVVKGTVNSEVGQTAVFVQIIGDAAGNIVTSGLGGVVVIDLLPIGGSLEPELPSPSRAFLIMSQFSSVSAVADYVL